MAYSIRFPRRHDKTDRNGRYAVRLCITKNKRRKYIAFEDTLEMMGAAISAPPGLY